MYDKLEAQIKKETSIQTIFLVEDDVSIREFLTQFIELETPYTIFSASDAAQALQMIDSTVPGLFLLDYQLPEMDGLELSDRLHSIRGLESVPTLMISAFSPPWKAIEQRGITFLRKPFDLERLRQTIRSFL